MHWGANRAVPAPVSVPTDAGVPFLDNASMSVWQASRPGAYEISDGLVNWSIFLGCGHDAAGIKPCHHASSSV